jgi:PAS domain S-box-containing protein
LPEAPLPHNEKERLAVLRSLDILDTPPEIAFDRITRAAARFLDVPICLVSLVDEDRQWFKSSYGLDAEETPRDVAFCSHAILGDAPLVVSDAAKDDRFAENPLFLGDPHVQFYAGIPLTLSDDIRLGTLCAIDHKPRQLTPEQLDFLSDLAGVVVDQFKLRKALSDVRDAGVQREADLQEIRDQALKTETVLKTVVDGIVTIDSAGLIHTFNPAAEKMFGYASEEVIGKNVNLLMPTPYSARHDDYIKAYLTTGDAKIIGRGRELIGMRKDGATFPMDLSISKMEINETAMFTGIVRDITEKQQLLFQIERARAIAEKANRAKSEFLSSMSHELRTPLNSVLGFSQILMTDPVCPLTEDQMESTKQIHSAGKHLLELINDVLDLSRIEAGKVELETTTLELRDILGECFDLMGPLARAAGISLKQEDFNDVSIMADRTCTKQVLLNLLSNAVKYNQDGGRVTISVAPPDGGHVIVSVADTGIGIPDDRKNELFQPFNRLGAEQSDKEGTGVGLVITRQLLDLMGGAITVSSVAGEGSTFAVSLPLAQE